MFKTLFLFCFALVANAYIMGVDIGGDSMKVSLVQSGKPLQIGM
jgi:hypothetical protein